jgi:DNA-binding NarL/FixJ family response regulator
MMRLVIIDDDPFVCGSLRTILDAQGDIEVVAVGHDGNEAQELYRLHVPDILLTDIQMPECNGLEAAAAILGQWPDARIVLLTTFSDDEYIISALRMGAMGYLIKQDVTTIAPALRLVMSGQSVLGNEVLGRMDHLMRDKASEAEGADKPDKMRQGDGSLVSSPVSSQLHAFRRPRACSKRSPGQRPDSVVWPWLSSV